MAIPMATSLPEPASSLSHLYVDPCANETEETAINKNKRIISIAGRRTIFARVRNFQTPESDLQSGAGDHPSGVVVAFARADLQIRPFRLHDEFVIFTVVNILRWRKGDHVLRA